MTGMTFRDEEYGFLLGYLWALDQMFHIFKKTGLYLSTQKDWRKLRSHQVNRLATVGLFSFEVNQKGLYERTKSTHAH
jgi:hypothetical protein